MNVSIVLLVRVKASTVKSLFWNMRTMKVIGLSNISIHLPLIHPFILLPFYKNTYYEPHTVPVKESI
jgi:hypothetical protein